MYLYLRVEKWTRLQKTGIWELLEPSSGNIGKWASQYGINSVNFIIVFIHTFLFTQVETERWPSVGSSWTHCCWGSRTRQRRCQSVVVTKYNASRTNKNQAVEYRDWSWSTLWSRTVSIVSCSFGFTDTRRVESGYIQSRFYFRHWSFQCWQTKVVILNIYDLSRRAATVGFSAVVFGSKYRVTNNILAILHKVRSCMALW